MSKCDIWPKIECQNKILNIKMRYSAPVRMSKKDFECQNSIFGPSSNMWNFTAVSPEITDDYWIFGDN